MYGGHTSWYKRGSEVSWFRIIQFVYLMFVDVNAPPFRVGCTIHNGVLAEYVWDRRRFLSEKGSHLDNFLLFIGCSTETKTENNHF